MVKEETKKMGWASQGKTVKQLIKELQSFEDQSLLVEISVDSGETHVPLSLVARSNGLCLLINME